MSCAAAQLQQNRSTTPTAASRSAFADLFIIVTVLFKIRACVADSNDVSEAVLLALFTGQGISRLSFVIFHLPFPDEATS
jgi:hypothetical protein